RLVAPIGFFQSRTGRHSIQIGQAHRPIAQTLLAPSALGALVIHKESAQGSGVLRQYWRERFLTVLHAIRAPRTRSVVATSGSRVVVGVGESLRRAEL